MREGEWEKGRRGERESEGRGDLSNGVLEYWKINVGTWHLIIIVIEQCGTLL